MPVVEPTTLDTKSFVHDLWRFGLVDLGRCERDVATAEQIWFAVVMQGSRGGSIGELVEERIWVLRSKGGVPLPHQIPPPNPSQDTNKSKCFHQTN